MAKKEKFMGKVILFSVITIVIIGIALYFIFFNTKSISEIKNPDYIGKTVRVSGEVKAVIKIGSLSGFTLEDESGTIAVRSDDLPKEGDKITVKGVLIKDTIFGYYIKQN